MPSRSSVLISLEQQDKDKTKLSLRIKIYCSVELLFCVAMWLWSMYNVIFAGRADFGALSFPLAIIACILGLLSVYYYTRKMNDRTRYFGQIHCYLIVLAQFLVTVYYIGVAIKSLKLQVYYSFMAVVFALSTLAVVPWSYRWYKLFIALPNGNDYSKLEDNTEHQDITTVDATNNSVIHSL